MKTRRIYNLKSGRRRGVALYSTVMIVALICSILGLAGLNVVRLERKQMRFSTDILDARQNARSGVELALKAIANDPGWRSNLVNGQESALYSLGSSGTGTVSWKIEDSDGSLTDSDTELRIHGIGRIGGTVQVSSLQVDGSTPAVYDSMQCSVYAVGNITQSSTTTTNFGPFASAANLHVGSEVLGDVEGNPVTLSEFGSVSGTITDPGPSRTMPPASVWDTYLPLATTIPFTSFPLDPNNSNKRIFSRNLLGATYNPFGPTSPNGVYYIAIPAGKHLNVTKSRIHATLLIELGTNAKFDTQQSCLWDPYAGNNYPAAIVKAAGPAVFDLKSSNATLKEQQTPKFNYNPPGEPYDGEADTDESDARVPLMRGLFHIIGSGVTTILASNLNLDGVVVTEGSVTLGANLTMNVDTNIFATPPLGYEGGAGGTPGPDLTVLPGTWLWEAAP